MYLDIIFFLLKYAPYWGFPLIVLAVQFLYINWLKESWPGMIIFGLLGLIAVIFVLYYFLHGGPAASQALWDLIHAAENWHFFWGQTKILIARTTTSEPR